MIYISRWLLLTNLVLVAWLVAMYGGRLKISTTRRREDGQGATRRGVGDSRLADMRLLLVGALVTSAAIHVALVPGHLDEWAGVLFILLAVWELAIAYMLLARVEERMVLLASVAISIAPLVLLLFSRTALVPDALAGALAVGSLLAALSLLRASGWLARRPPASAHARGLVLVALIAVTAIGVAGTGLRAFDAFGITGSKSVMDMSH